MDDVWAEMRSIESNIKTGKISSAPKNEKKVSEKEIKEISKPVKKSKAKESKEEQHTTFDAGEGEQTLRLINAYLSHERFKDFLKNSGFSLAKAKKVDHKEQYLQDIRSAIENRSANLATEKIVVGAISYGESIACSRGLPLNGLTQELQEDEYFSDALAQVSIENGNLVPMSPMMRVGLSVLLTSAAVINLNRAQMKKTQPIEQTIEQPKTKPKPAKLPTVVSDEDQSIADLIG